MQPQQAQVVVNDYWDFYRVMKHNCITDTTVTWDLGKLSKISKNRVIKWIDIGSTPFRGGQAAEAYNKVIEYVGVPKIIIPDGLSKFKSSNYYDFKTIEFNGVNEEIYNHLNDLYKAQRVIYRLEHGVDHGYFKWHYPNENLSANAKNLYIASACDTKELKKAVKKLMDSNEFVKRIEHAKELVSSGGKIQIAIKKAH